MRPALPLVIVVAGFMGSMAFAQGFSTDGKTSYSRDDRIRIPFELRSGGSATSVKLYYSFDGGSWQEYESVRAGQKREFIFRADKEGAYSFATMTFFNDGSSDPPSKDRLMEQRRVVIDRSPPRVNSVRSVISADGAPGLEWDVSDDNLDPKGIALEFRWPEMARFEPIDKGTLFSARDHRHWQMRAGDRMMVRVVAKDRAGNRVESEAVPVSLKDGEKSDGFRDVPPERKLNSTTGAGRDGRDDMSNYNTARSVQPSVHYVKNQAITVNFNADVGPSGLTAAYLYVADEKLDWRQEAKEGPKPAPEATVADKPRTIPLNFEYKAPKDGVYNFIIIVANHRDVSRREPKKGDLGDVQVIVDTRPPDVEIISTKVSPNGDRGAVVDIRWKATDANIAPEPIMLEYQAKGKEWMAMTPSWIDNTGQYSWTAPTGEAHEFLIRVKCKDRADNVGMKVTPQPVNTDLAKPKVEIIEVKPGASNIRIGEGGNDRRPPAGPTPPPIKLP